MSGLAGQRSSEGPIATERSADDRSSGQVDSSQAQNDETLHRFANGLVDLPCLRRRHNQRPGHRHRPRRARRSPPDRGRHGAHPRRPHTHSLPLIALAGLALAAIIAAWLSGARFVGTTTNGASLAMAIATGIAILAYILILFLVATPAARREARREGAA